MSIITPKNVYYAGLFAISIFIVVKTGTVRIEEETVIAAPLVDVHRVLADPRKLLSFHGVIMELDGEVVKEERDGYTTLKYTVLETVPVFLSYFTFQQHLQVESVITGNSITSNLTIVSPLCGEFPGHGKFTLTDKKQDGKNVTHVHDVLELELLYVFHFIAKRVGDDAHATLLRNLKEYMENKRE
ncbi:uncharacterized protein LOC144449479 [Glandiceps talaboti]